jgi:hypothetical protein
LQGDVVKLSNLIDPRFKQAINKLNQQQLPLKAAFKIKGIIDTIDAELAKYEAVRQSALLKYGKKNDDGSVATDQSGNVVLEGDNANAFVKELNDLLALDLTLDKVSAQELGDNITISSEELFLLDFISA